MSTEKKLKTFIVKKTMPTYVTASFEVVAKNEKDAYNKFIEGDYDYAPVGGLEIGATIHADPKIEVKEKDESA